MVPKHTLVINITTPSLGVSPDVLCFAGWLSECTASHTAQNNTSWSNVEYFQHTVLLCGVQFTYTLCSLHTVLHFAAYSLTTNLQSTTGRVSLVHQCTHNYDKPALMRLLNPDIPTFQCCQPGSRVLLIRSVVSGSVCMCVWRALISTVGSCVVDPGVGAPCKTSSCNHASCFQTLSLQF